MLTLEKVPYNTTVTISNIRQLGRRPISTLGRNKNTRQYLGLIKTSGFALGYNLTQILSLVFISPAGRNDGPIALVTKLLSFLI